MFQRVRGFSLISDLISSEVSSAVTSRLAELPPLTGQASPQIHGRPPSIKPSSIVSFFLSNTQLQGEQLLPFFLFFL